MSIIGTSTVTARPSPAESAPRPRAKPPTGNVPTVHERGAGGLEKPQVGSLWEAGGGRKGGTRRVRIRVFGELGKQNLQGIP